MVPKLVPAMIAEVWVTFMLSNLLESIIIDDEVPKEIEPSDKFLKMQF